MSRTAARDSTNPVAITACAIRLTRKIPKVGASIAATEANVNSAAAVNITGLRPKRSEIGPITIWIAAVAAR